MLGFLALAVRGTWHSMSFNLSQSFCLCVTSSYPEESKRRKISNGTSRLNRRCLKGRGQWQLWNVYSMAKYIVKDVHSTYIVISQAHWKAGWHTVQTAPFTVKVGTYTMSYCRPRSRALRRLQCCAPGAGKATQVSEPYQYTMFRTCGASNVEQNNKQQKSL